MFLQAEFGNQVIRDTKYKTTDRRVVNEILSQNQNQNADKQTRARQNRSQNKGCSIQYLLHVIGLQVIGTE